MKIKLIRVASGYDGKKCRVHARVARAPGLSVMTAQYLDVSGSDLFGGIMSAVSLDGEHFSTLREEPTLRPIKLRGRVRVGCDATPLYHAPSGKLLLIGQTADYTPDAKRPIGDVRFTFYSVYDGERGGFGEMRFLEMPEGFSNSGNGSGQSVVLDNGEILIPIYYRAGERYASTVMRCAFDGESLSLIELGSSHSIDIERGICEPSIIRHRDKFYMTVRNDLTGYILESDDGLHYYGMREWLFDDGESVGNYNTQQHFMILGGELYLVYTRRGADNDHVFRHRAPLFAARVEDMRLVRSSEQVVIPERGARLGNFGAESYPDGRAAVMAAEWMQPSGCERYGSDNSIYLALIEPDK